MRVALAKELGGINRVELGDRPDPAPAADQALIRVHGAGVGPWDVGFLSGGFPGLALPFVPGQEIAGVAEAAGDGAGVHPGERAYASLFPAGGGFAELALASADRLAPMPAQGGFPEAAALRRLVDTGRLRPRPRRYCRWIRRARRWRRSQLAPQRSDRGPVAADDPGRVVEGLGGQRQRGTVEKQRSPWG